MGWWKTRNGVIGDSPADVAAKFWKDVEAAYLKETGRLPLQGEIADLLEFTSCGVFSVCCGDVAYPWTSATRAEEDTPRAAAVGECGALSSFAIPPGGCLANVDPETGEHYKAPKITFGEEEQNDA